MKIILLILLSLWTQLGAEYPRYKIRGPPYPPRIPTSQQFIKKWHQPPQYPPRGHLRRPFPQMPLMMHDSHKIPMGIPQAPPRPVALPVRTFWKNTQASLKFMPEKVYKSQPPPPPVLPEKPFLSAPSIAMQELDYHIQTNNIPTTYTNPIKQVGEKGPIHTIPAPNLSLRDKPIIVEEVRNEINYQHPPTYVKVEQSHQYQVTEHPEPNPSQKFFRAQQQYQQIQQQHLEQQQLHQQQLQQNQLQQQQQQLQQLEIQQQMQLQQNAHNQFESQSQSYPPQNTQQNSPQGDIILNNNLTPQELYQLIESAYPKEQQQQQTQQLSDYQTLLSQQIYQPEVSLSDHLQESESGQVAFQPEYHSFNYDEQAHQKSLSKKQLSSLVSTSHNFHTGADELQYVPASRGSAEQIAQSEIVQNYFEKRADVVDNDVEPDAESSSNKPKDKEEQTLLKSSYYSSLPSKEAAERLAQLQAAGKVNSNLMKISTNSQNSEEPIIILDESTIDDEGDTEGNRTGNNSRRESVEYEEYSDEDNTASDEPSEEFGHKIQSRERPE
nr:putative uncharacterized protein DDB_G0271606 [Leptinotarsa decemlineata]